jgi:hypothetical protein
MPSGRVILALRTAAISEPKTAVSKSDVCDAQLLSASAR